MTETLGDRLIAVDAVEKEFHGVKALDGVSLSVHRGRIVGLIGPNGAGKTTLLNTISGITRLDKGSIRFRDGRIDGLSPYQIARKGISRTFQVPRIFRRLSVIENVLTPVLYRGRVGKGLRDRAVELLEFIGLKEKAEAYAGELSGGQQKLLEFARALMTDPELILMDEPFAGVHPDIKDIILKRIDQLHTSESKTFLIVSHDMRVVAGLCQYLFAMNSGRLLIEGPPEKVLGNELVVKAYLGSE